MAPLKSDLEYSIRRSARARRVRVTVDVGTDTPGTGPFSGAQNLPAFDTFFLGVTSVRVDAFGGDDGRSEPVRRPDRRRPRQVPARQPRRRGRGRHDGRQHVRFERQHARQYYR